MRGGEGRRQSAFASRERRDDPSRHATLTSDLNSRHRVPKHQSAPHDQRDILDDPRQTECKTSNSLDEDQSEDVEREGDGGVAEKVVRRDEGGRGGGEKGDEGSGAFEEGNEEEVEGEADLERAREREGAGRSDEEDGEGARRRDGRQTGA